MRLVLASIVAVLCASGAAALGLSSLEGQQPEAVSLLGRPLVPPALSGDARKNAEAELARSRAAYDADPRNADAILALARATASMGRITEALVIYTRGIEAFPDDARFYVERGRYYLVIRKFDIALKDFRKAAETQPEANCDAGIASYLRLDFKTAHSLLQACSSTQPWAYLAALRAGSTPAARPALKPGDTIGSAYLAAAEQIAAGQTDKARDLLKTIVEKNRDAWMDPVYIAAEADYARVRQHRRR